MAYLTKGRNSLELRIGNPNSKPKLLSGGVLQILWTGFVFAIYFNTLLGSLFAA
jgi:hypothetical protein